MTKGTTPPQGGYYGIFNDSFPPILDGVTLAVQNYVYWLQRLGMTPCVVTPWNPAKAEYPYEVMRFFSLPIINRRPYRYGYPKLDPFIWSRLRRTPFRLVHSHCPFSSGRLGVYVARKQKVPLIGTFHSKYRSDLQHSFKIAPWCVPIIMKRILSFFNACDEVWIPQAAVEETVREYGYKGPLTVVENGNDMAALAPDDLRAFKDESRRLLGIAEDEMALLFVGQHIWEKGIGVIADALEMLPADLKFRMDFIGTGYAFEDLRKRIEGAGLAGKVRLHGTIDDRTQLARHYAAADLFLFPSFYDNAPLVVREAAAMGTPSVLLEGSTASEVIRNGVNGYLIQRTPVSYAALLTGMSGQRSEIYRVGMEARNSLVRSWEDVVGEVADRYRVILKNYRPR